MDFILDNLAVGSFADAAAAPPDITALLCVARERDLHVADRTYHKVPVVDMQPIPDDQLAEAVAWIRDRAGRHKVLVFCNAGVGRSSSVAVAYLCCVRGMGFGPAVEHVAARHPGMSILPMLRPAVERVRDRLGGRGGRG